MEKEGARYQKLEQLHERRKQVVRLHLAGTAVMQVVALTGLSYPTVQTIDLFSEGGWPAIKPANWGRNVGDGRRLNAEQEGTVRRTIC
ncbi:MAG: helix-turn-helix domain-containing protein, partial [Burkholderia sp.]